MKNKKTIKKRIAVVTRNDKENQYLIINGESVKIKSMKVFVKGRCYVCV